MTALQPIHSSSADSFAYFGEHEGWLVGLSVNRDSDALERSTLRKRDDEYRAAYGAGLFGAEYSFGG